MTTTTTAPQSVDVTAVLANIDQGEALRDRIKALQAQLKVHEDAIKDVLGEATEGVDSAGKIVVRYPVRNRTDLIRKEVEKRLDPAEYAACQKSTTYRTLLYGEG
jgi:hypothetical protein